MITSSASFTKRPRTNAGASSVKRPSPSTGLNMGQPSRRPTSRSSAPKAGAMCTIPVPSCIETNGAATTRWVSPLTFSKGGAYAAPASVRPGNDGPILTAPSPSSCARASATRRSRSPVRMRTYVSSGATAAPRFEMSVHGVVVQTTSEAPAASDGPSTIGNRTNRLGSLTCW